MTAAAVAMGLDRWPPWASLGAKMLQDRHERCAMTTATTPTERVDLDCHRRAPVGVGPCRMARIVRRTVDCRAAVPACLRNAKPRTY